MAVCVRVAKTRQPVAQTNVASTRAIEGAISLWGTEHTGGSLALQSCRGRLDRFREVKQRLVNFKAWLHTHGHHRPAWS